MTLTTKAYWRSFPRELAIFRTDGPHLSVLLEDRIELADALSLQGHKIDTAIMVLAADPFIIMQARKALGLESIDAWVPGPNGSRRDPRFVQATMRPPKIEGAPQIKISGDLADYPAHQDYAPAERPFGGWPRKHSTDPNDWFGVGVVYDAQDSWPLDSLYSKMGLVFEKQLDAAIGGRYPVWRRIA